MEFRAAITKAISHFGKQVVTERRFVSVLCDYHGFDSVIPAKTILRNGFQLGYMDKLYQNYSNNQKIASISQDFAQKTGFEKSLVTLVFNQITEVLQSKGENDTITYNYKKHQVPIIFIVDSSDSMTGVKIGSLNDAIENCISLFSLNDQRDPYAQGYIASLAYGDIAFWLDHISYKTSEYIWNGINGNGKSFASKAFVLLKKDFKNLFEKKHFDPIYILISASKSDDDYRPILQELSEYYEYEYALRIGIAVGDKADYGLLKSFSSSEKHVLHLHDIEKLSSLIEYRCSYPELPINDEPMKSFYDN